VRVSTVSGPLPRPERLGPGHPSGPLPRQERVGAGHPSGPLPAAVGSGSGPATGRTRTATPPAGQTLDPETWALWQRQLATTIKGRRTHRWR
jgi:hypothetical protein